MGAKGKPKTEGSGRKKGTPNKRTAKVRAILEEQLAPHLDNVGSLIAQIDDPKERLQVIAALLPFFAPKMQAIDMTAKQESNVRLEQSLADIDNQFSEKKAEMMARKVKLVSFE